jgi:type II secretory pathway pseudopilin PulG
MPFSVAEQQPEVAGNYVSRCHGAIMRSRARAQIENGMTQKALLTAALALRAYRLDNGAYPGDLRDLVPDYLGAVPQDPFAGDAALRYRIDGDRYILYSIGPDGVDDGGTAIFSTDLVFGPKSEYRVHPNSKGDIVAGVNW